MSTKFWQFYQLHKAFFFFCLYCTTAPPEPRPRVKNAPLHINILKLFSHTTPPSFFTFRSPLFSLLFSRQKQKPSLRGISLSRNGSPALQRKFGAQILMDR